MLWLFVFRQQRVGLREGAPSEGGFVYVRSHVRKARICDSLGSRAYECLLCVCVCAYVYREGRGLAVCVCVQFIRLKRVYVPD